MKSAIAWLGMALLASAIPLGAQEIYPAKDFLTDHEADEIRTTQEPDKRIERYLHYARLRLELVRQALEVEKPGRSVLIHRNLEEFGRIIETVDMVVDDALDREIDMTTVMPSIVEVEQEYLAALRKIEENPAADHDRYEFVLADAIEITSDSIEIAQEDLGIRTAEIRSQDARDKKEREEQMTPERRAEVKAVEKAAAKKETETKSKRPTLLKPGEGVKK
jgi:hypothetical protein